MAQEWYYTQDNQKAGPISEAELKELAALGKLSPDDLVWKDGMPDWRPAGRLKGVVFKSGGGPPPIPGTDSGRRVLQSAEGAMNELTNRVGILDLKFQQFATPHLIGIVFTLSLIVLSLAFCAGAGYALWNLPAIKAVFSIAGALIVYSFLAVCLRVFLELCVVVFRIAEHLSYLRHLGDGREAQ